MKISNVYQGFKLIEENHINEINSTAQLFRHEKSGAQLLHLANDDDNNVFSITFKTPPQDDTGVAHILEHSVLCGSQKFPIKKPFVELLKGSLNNFLNAFTFLDKTIYPIASQNEKDFFNLINVYLDATLHPNIYKNEEIFLQEGWRYELNDKKDSLIYKGVVYNEMKGAMSSPEGFLFRIIPKTLYPDVAYAFNSSGDPEKIPNLTYGEFLNFHRKFYHPSNSYIYLYGNIDIEKKLKFLDEEYLSHFNTQSVDSTVHLQQPFNAIHEHHEKYSVIDGEKDKTFLALNFSIGCIDEPELTLGFNILANMLLQSSASPLKKALLQSGLGKDMFGLYRSDLQQPIFSIILKNSNTTHKEPFKKLVFEELQKLVDHGIDKKLVEASINRVEFSLRDTDSGYYPKGLTYNMIALQTWIHGTDPFMLLKYDDALRSIREKTHNGYFENIISQYLIKNNHASLLILEPSQGLDSKRNEALTQKLNTYKNSLSEIAINHLIESTAHLKKCQSELDSPEDLKTIPELNITDIKVETATLPLVQKNDEVTVLHHPVPCNGIVYARLLFDSSFIPKEQIPTLSLLSNLLCEVDTKNYSYMELANEINTYLGNLNSTATSYTETGSTSVFYPKFTVSSKGLISQTKMMVKLISEVIFNSQFTDKVRIHEIIKELRSHIEFVTMQSGHIIALDRLEMRLSQADAYREHLSGVTFYNYLVDLDEHFDQRADQLLSDLQSLYSSIFNKDKMIISITSDEEAYLEIEPHFHQLLSKLENNKISAIDYNFEHKSINEALIIPGQVQHVCKGGSFKKCGYEYSGKFQVMAKILTLDYLWNNVREKGGAYGAMTSFRRNGNMFFVSYRDPNLKSTLTVYDSMSHFFKSFRIDKRELNKYIIGTIAELDQPLTPSEKGAQALSDYICHLSHEQKKRERADILNTTIDDIRDFSKLLEDVMSDAMVSVVGTDEKINESSELFNEIQMLLQ